MIEDKRSESDRKAEYRQRKAAEEAKAKAAQEAQKQADLSQVVPRDNHGTTTGVPHPSGSCDDTGTGTGTLINIYVPQATPDRTPNCPHKEIIALYRKHLPNLPQPKMSLWEKSENARALKARWLWVITEFKEDGSRIAETIPQGLEWFDRFFAYVARSDFLTGRSGSWCADLGWLVKLKNFEKAVQGNYENKNAEAAT